MDSLVRRFTPQIFGFRGSAKFNHTSFFVEDESDYTLVHRQMSTSAEETIKAKPAYEDNLRQFGKEVRHYHTYNGTYDVVKNSEEINNNKKTLTFYGVGSHHHNFPAENRI